MRGEFILDTLALFGIARGVRVRVKASASPATVGEAPRVSDYRKTFFEAHPKLKELVEVVHHNIEQQVLKRYPGRFTKKEIMSLENLRGIPKGTNTQLHLKDIRRAWDRFYAANPNATRVEILDGATRMDRVFGYRYLPEL